MQLSIIIVNYNAQDLLRACLISVFEHTKAIDFEVIVVDNASTDGSREMLEQRFLNVKKILNSVNHGFAAANNQAIKQASGDYILLLNSDTVVPDEAINKTLEYMRRNPEAGIVGCKLLNPDGTLQPSCRSFPSIWNLFTESLFLYRVFNGTELFGKYYMSFFDHESIREVEVVMGAFMLIRREVFEQVGLFDEDYFMYAEETDFCYRAYKLGYKTYFFPEASIIHIGGGSTHDNQKSFDLLHSSLLLFLHKHFSGIRLFLAVGLKNLGVALRIVTYFVAGLFTFDSSLLKKSRYFFRVLF